jgi:hypothetical protein
MSINYTATISVNYTATISINYTTSVPDRRTTVLVIPRLRHPASISTADGEVKAKS